jgi:hypothetical protein
MTLTTSDREANATAVFHPAVSEDANNGAYAYPCTEMAGVQVYAYIRDGILVVSVDYASADISETSPFRTYEDNTAIPTLVYIGERPVPAWEGIPDDAISEDDARTLRKAGLLAGDDWVLPGWVYGPA